MVVKKTPVVSELGKLVDKDGVKKVVRKRATKGSKTKITTRTGMVVSESYCRKCMMMKKPTEFMQAVDLSLFDSNGLMSVCKECCNAAYNSSFVQTHSMDKSILFICKSLNIRYEQAAIDAVKIQLETYAKNGKETDKIFSLYTSKLRQVQGRAIGDVVEEDLTYLDISRPIIPVEELISDDDFDGTGEDLKIFWGATLESDDYVFLENKMGQWKDSYSCSNKAEEFFLKELCFKELELRNARLGGLGNVDSILKSMDNLLKSAALTPAQATAASQGKNLNTWGVINKMIETTTPSEYYKDKKLFSNFDGLLYFKNFIIRAISNFVTFSKDFNISEDSSSMDMFDDVDTQSSESEITTEQENNQ